MPRTLLLADDSVTIQKVVGLSFASEDVVLVTVSNGDDAISRARELRPDLVLADIVMPGRNGYEVCEAIKSDPALRHIPVLLLTGTFEAFDQERARRAGADGHVTKPFEAQALVDQVKELMARPALSPPPAFEALPAASATDPFLEDPLADAPALALPLRFDAEAAVGELELATVAEEESSHDLFGAEEVSPLDAPIASGDAFEIGQETFRGTPLFAPEPDTAPPVAERSAPIEAPLFQATSFPSPSFDATDTDAFSPRASAPAPATLLPEDDDFDLGFDDEPFVEAEPEAAREPAPMLDASPFGEDDPTADTVLDTGPAPGYDIAFDDLDDPLAATRGRFGAAAAPVAELAATVFLPGPATDPGLDLTPALRERLHDTLEKIAWEAFADLSDTIVRQAIERVEAIAWEVIPQLAEQLVREEIRRMKGE